MADDKKHSIPASLADSIGFSFMRASHGDPWDCIRFTGTLINDLRILSEINGDGSLRSRCMACTKIWEQAIYEFEQSNDSSGNPNWGHPVLLCSRVLGMLGNDAAIKYGKLPSESGSFLRIASTKPPEKDIIKL